MTNSTSYKESAKIGLSQLCFYPRQNYDTFSSILPHLARTERSLFPTSRFIDGVRRLYYIHNLPSVTIFWYKSSVKPQAANAKAKAKALNMGSAQVISLRHDLWMSDFTLLRMRRYILTKKMKKVFKMPIRTLDLAISGQVTLPLEPRRHAH